MLLFNHKQLELVVKLHKNVKFYGARGTYVPVKIANGNSNSLLT